MAREYVERKIFDMMEENSNSTTATSQFTRRYPPVPGRAVARSGGESGVLLDRPPAGGPVQRVHQSNGAQGRPHSVDYSTLQEAQSIGDTGTVKYIPKVKSTPAVNVTHRNLSQMGRSATVNELSSSATTAHNGGASPYYIPDKEDQSNGGGVIHNIKNNIEHYSSVIQGMAFPVLFRLSGREKKNARSRSGSRNRHKSAESPKLRHKQNPDKELPNQDHNRNSVLINQRLSPDDGYKPIENIELYHMNGFVFSSEREKGKGHHFVLVQLSAPTWCDNCGDFIWGIYKQCLKCTNCQYTCHHPCRKLVTLDCAQNDAGTDKGRPQTSETCLTQERPQVDDTDSGYHTGDKTLAEQARRVTQGMVARQPGEFTMTREDLRKNIEAFNFNNYGLIMSLQPESITFQGFIRVYMNLIRPINMSLSVRPPSIYEVLSHEDEETEGGVKDGSAQIASFYLPKDTTKVIHISSDTTTQEVIKALLSKYKITDNPRKFALYERVEEEGCQSVMRRCVEDEQPLPLCLSWGSQGLNTHKFVLQENDTGEIIWDAFSIPELENFLKILNREEEEYQEQIKAKYHLMNVHIIKRLEEMDKQRKKTTEKGKNNTKSKAKSGSQQKTNSQQSSASLSGSQSEKSRTDTDLHLDTGAENKSRTGKEKSPPADKFGEDEREPVFV